MFCYFFSCYYLSFLLHPHIKYHQQHETNGEAYGAEVAVLAA